MHNEELLVQVLEENPVMSIKDHTNDYGEAWEIIASADEFDEVRVYKCAYNQAGYRSGYIGYSPDALGKEVTRENFCSVVATRYKHPVKLQGVDAVMWCAQRGMEISYTRVHEVGFRAGERDGVASEKMPDGSFEVVEYGMLGRADGKYPYGTKRVVIRRFDATES